VSVGSRELAVGNRCGGAREAVTIQSYKDLRVWQLSMDLAVEAYRVTSGFPTEERYGLTSQIRRAAASVPANIAEGYGRDIRGSYVQHLRIAQGSLKELETHLILAHRVERLAERPLNDLSAQCDDIGRMLRSLIRTLESSI
jgi:four helix bundle protein